MSARTDDRDGGRARPVHAWSYSTFLVFEKSPFQWLKPCFGTAARLLKVWDIFVLCKRCLYPACVWKQWVQTIETTVQMWDVPGGSGKCFPQLFIHYSMSTLPPKHVIYIHGIPDRRWGRKQRLAVLRLLLLQNVLWDCTYQKLLGGFLNSLFRAAFKMKNSPSIRGIRANQTNLDERRKVINKFLHLKQAGWGGYLHDTSVTGATVIWETGSGRATAEKVNVVGQSLFSQQRCRILRSLRSWDAGFCSSRSEHVWLRWSGHSFLGTYGSDSSRSNTPPHPPPLSLGLFRSLTVPPHISCQTKTLPSFSPWLSAAVPFLLLLL